MTHSDRVHDGKRVVFLVRGLEGLGHVTPSAAIAERLIDRGVDVHFITYENGVKFLNEQGFGNVVDIGPPAHLPGAVPWKHMFEATKQILPVILKLKPDLVVVDGESDALFLLKSLGVKIMLLATPYYIDLDFSYWKEFALYGKAGLIQADRIVVYGFFKPHLRMPKYTFVGPIVRGNPTPKLGKTVPILLSYGCSDSMVSFARQCAAILTTMGYTPLLIGYKKGRIKDLASVMAQAPLVITHGGMSAIDEAIVLGKPLLVMHDDRNEEKRRNGFIVEREGKGRQIDVSGPVTNSRVSAVIRSTLRLRNSLAPVQNGLACAVDEVLDAIDA